MMDKDCQMSKRLRLTQELWSEVDNRSSYGPDVWALDLDCMQKIINLRKIMAP